MGAIAIWDPPRRRDGPEKENCWVTIRFFLSNLAQVTDPPCTSLSSPISEGHHNTYAPDLRGLLMNEYTENGVWCIITSQ